MEGGPWEVPPYCPCVQSARGSALCLYGVSLVLLAMGGRTLGGVRSYTCVVWGRWRMTVILAASSLRVVVWGTM